jgi:hypothetical protein
VTSIELGSLSTRYLAAEFDNLSDLASRRTLSSTAVSRTGRLTPSQFKGRYLFFKIDSLEVIETLLAQLGLTLPNQWRDLLRYYIFGLTYTSATHQLYLDTERIVLSNLKRRLRIILPITAFQIQTASLPMSITANPIAPCQSQIFKLCLEGNIEMAKIWFKSSWASPFVVNQHGENLLHVSCIHYFVVEWLIPEDRCEICSC